MKEEIGKNDADNVYRLMMKFDGILNILETKKEKIPTEINKLIKEREKARKNKNFEKSDKIRREIENKGYILEDTGDGTVIKRK